MLNVCFSLSRLCFLPLGTDPESFDTYIFGLGPWELALIIASPIAVSLVALMILLSVRHQRRRRMINRRMVDTEHNMDSADVPILGEIRFIYFDLFTFAL